MAMSKNNNGSYYEAALKRRKKSEAEKMMELKKLKKGSSESPKPKIKLAPVSPKQKKVNLQRAVLKKNFLKSGKKK
jgi:hypothetical protein